MLPRQLPLATKGTPMINLQNGSAAVDELGRRVIRELLMENAGPVRRRRWWIASQRGARIRRSGLGVNHVVAHRDAPPRRALDGTRRDRDDARRKHRRGRGRATVCRCSDSASGPCVRSPARVRFVASGSLFCSRDAHRRFARERNCRTRDRVRVPRFPYRPVSARGGRLRTAGGRDGPIVRCPHVARAGRLGASPVLDVHAAVRHR